MNASIAALFQRLTQGVYVIGVGGENSRNAFTAAWVMQVSYDPLLLALSINSHHSSYDMLRAGRAFSVNVLGKHQVNLARHFGQPASADKLASVDWAPGRTGVPLLQDAIAWFECQAANEYSAGDHVLVLGKVVDGKLLDSTSQPMTYRETGALDGSAALFPDAFEKS